MVARRDRQVVEVRGQLERPLRVPGGARRVAQRGAGEGQERVRVLAGGIQADGLLQEPRRRAQVAAANAGVGKGIKSEAYADAKTSAAELKAALTDAENLWVVAKKDDAVKMSKDAIAKVTALETILSAATVDQQAAFAAAKEVGGTCAACHKEYRVQNEDKTYAIKPGVL